MNTEKTLKAVIDKYKLSEPVPFDVRMAMEKSRKENLIKILKRDVHRAIFLSMVVSFFLWIKKFGISISIIKSAVAVSVALIIGAGIITVAGVYTTGKIIDYISDEKQKIEQVQDIKIDSGSNEKTEESGAPEIISYAVAVSPVEMDNASYKLLSEYRNIMIRELRKIKGTKAAINLNSLDEYHLADKTLNISIIKLNEKSQGSGDESVYRISAKIISSTNSRVLMHTSETAAGENAISGSIQKLAAKLSAKL